MARGPAQLENRLTEARGLGHLDSARLGSAGFSGFGSSRLLAQARRRGSGSGLGNQRDAWLGLSSCIDSGFGLAWLGAQLGLSGSEPSSADLG